jgi:hypothetical protein
MAPKDWITVLISCLALLVSVVTYLLLTREDKRGTRQALTDTLTALGEVSLAMTKLKIENPSASNDVMSLRRTYNSQRRYLANHAEFLLDRIPELSADIDHNMLAVAFEAIGDLARAEEHWGACVARSPSDALRAMNLRGFARFLFYRGNPSVGRQKYEESLQVNLPDNDPGRRIRADTFALWFATEREFGFLQEADRRRESAVAEARRIGHQGMQREMLRYIEDLASRPQALEPVAEPAPLPPKGAGS